ncbi:SRPBCC family protein [Flavihumibacter solisilvae]|uniref:Activator of Hsp90 ATPase homologue 1/2-like C-terminal domain-containing protein n=1 Tax=Flavihumibacter solisilvae TaxID=1349421 RepID=A0A0C1L1Y9_9BACT|nr:SRPBCC domain-containing protein [Flavihumibacter solisilvae]KIC93611.1 hypothetical protein OI18_17500 [Flavihumibacter solisilvae]
MPDIRHEVLIAATAESVFDAIARQEGLAAWWTPHTIAKPEPGSVSRFTFGSGYFKEMEVIELKSGELVKWLCVAGASEWIGTTISFKLQAGSRESLLNSNPEAQDQIQQAIETGNVTLLSLQHEGWKEYTPMFAECNYTWAQFLRSLKLFCETGKGRPWPNQHNLHY